MFSNFARSAAGRRAMSTVASDNGRVVMTAAIAGAGAGAAASFVVGQARGPPPPPNGGEPPAAPKAKGSTTTFSGLTDETRSKVAGEGQRWTKPVVIASPALEPLAVTLRKRLGSEEFSEARGPTTLNERFKSDDANIKFNWERVVGRKVVLLFDTVDQSRFFEQLALLQALQGFAVPDASDKSTKWKTYVDHGQYSWGRAAHICVVMPWYRPCQMERTSRWQMQEDGKWTNADPKGAWLDVPNALYYARLLCTPGSVPPLPGPHASLDNMPLMPLWRPPVELVFVELHEEVPVSQSVSDLGATIRMERFVPFFLDKYKGKKTYPGKKSMYILFPDHGAHNRYSQAVKDKLGLDDDHILYIQKTRVGEQITQSQKLFYEQGHSKELGEKTSFIPSDNVLII
jgi:hypothetical protein